MKNNNNIFPAANANHCRIDDTITVTKPILKNNDAFQDLKNIETISHHTKIKSYFNSLGWKIDNCNTEKVEDNILNLAESLASISPAVQDLINNLRQSINKPSKKSYTFDLEKYSDSQRENLKKLIEKLEKCFITKRKILNNSKYTYVINRFAPVINFINGKYLEIYAKHVAEKKLAAISKVNSIDYEILSSVKISKNDIHREIDLVIRVNNNIFLCEAKSGAIDFDDINKFVEFCYNLKIDTSNQILLTTNTESDIRKALKYFYKNYYLPNDFNNKIENIAKCSA